MFREVIYFFVVVALIPASYYLGHPFYRAFASHREPVTALGIFLGAGAVVFVSAYIADKIRISIHDRRLRQKAADMEMKDFYETPEWQNALRNYLSHHPFKTVSRGGVTSLVKRFFQFSGMNFRAAGFLTIIAAGYYLLVGATDAESWQSHFRNTFMVAAVFYGIVFFPVLFITTVPFKSWRKQYRKKNPNGAAVLEKMFDGAKYVSSGESLMVLGDTHVLLANLNGVMTLPWDSIRSVSRTIWIYPRRLMFGSKNPQSRYYTGLIFKTGLCVSVVPGVTDDPVPLNWGTPDSFVHLYETNIDHGDIYGSEGITLQFTFNEYQMALLESEIRKRIGQSEEDSRVRLIEKAQRRLDFGNYNLSDYV